MNIFDLTGRTALVTGSSRGIGRGIADAMAEGGARVLFHGRTPPADLPDGATFLNVELDGEDAPRVLAEKAFAAAPELSVLVCNAGSFFDIDFLEMTAREWDATMHLNVRAPYFLIQTFAKKLIAKKRAGSIVIIGSTNGFRAEYDSSAYDVSKGALVMMTRTLALTLAAHNIRVNCVAPGLIRTPLTESWIDENHAMRAHYEKNTPLGRIGNLQDCAGAAVFLASDASSYITGQVLIADGGLTLPQIGKL